MTRVIFGSFIIALVLVGCADPDRRKAESGSAVSTGGGAFPLPSLPVKKRSTDGRYIVYESGVIYDSKTNLEWLVGPDKSTNYEDAVKWVKECKVAGGNWRMPTKEELRELYQKGKGTRNMDPVFETTGWGVWAEPEDPSSAWDFYFYSGHVLWIIRDGSDNSRVFAARSRR